MIGQSQSGHGQGQGQGQIISQSEAEFMSMETTYTTTRAAAAAGSGGQRAVVRGSRVRSWRALWGKPRFFSVSSNPGRGGKNRLNT